MEKTMSQDATMTFRLEPELRAEFYRAAQASHRPAAQLLRDLMRDYVRQMRSSRVPAISPDERLRREEAVRYARASVGLEGFRISETEEERARRFICGEMDLLEFLQANHDAA